MYYFIIIYMYISERSLLPMFYFTEDCVIGIESLDDDHRYLFSLMERAMRMLLA